MVRSIAAFAAIAVIQTLHRPPFLSKRASRASKGKRRVRTTARAARAAFRVGALRLSRAALPCCCSCRERATPLRSRSSPLVRPSRDDDFLVYNMRALSKRAAATLVSNLLLSPCRHARAACRRARLPPCATAPSRAGCLLGATAMIVLSHRRPLGRDGGEISLVLSARARCGPLRAAPSLFRRSARAMRVLRIDAPGTAVRRRRRREPPWRAPAPTFPLVVLSRR